MVCPLCGAGLNLALNYGAGVMANSLANHIRARHPQAATAVVIIGGAVIAAVLYWLVRLVVQALFT